MLQLAKVIIACLLVLSALVLQCKADDGAFLSRGDELFPMEETTIQLQHEILRFHYNDEKDVMEVDVLFEFFNPGPKKDLLIGFVTPPSSQDYFNNYLLFNSAKVPYSKPQYHCYVNDFTIFKDGQQIPYNRNLQFKKKSFFIANGDSIYEPDYWTFTFTTTFNPGINVIHHTYSYDGDLSDIGVRDFSYRLSTGCQWANKEIGHLELYIDPGINKLMILPTSLDSVSKTPIIWEKSGLINSYYGTSIEGYPAISNISKYCYVKNGYLYIDAQHFKATNDLSVTFLTSMIGLDALRKPDVDKSADDPYLHLYYFPSCFPTKIFKDMYYWNANSIAQNLEDSIVELSLNDLRILKNIPFALAGYDFKNPELKAYFSQFIWYFPDPNVPNSLDLLTDEQRNLVNLVSAQIDLLTKKEKN